MKKIISNEIDLLFTFYKNQEEEYKQPSKYIYEMCISNNIFTEDVYKYFSQYQLQDANYREKMKINKSDILLFFPEFGYVILKKDNYNLNNIHIFIYYADNKIQSINKTFITYGY